MTFEIANGISYEGMTDRLGWRVALAWTQSLGQAVGTGIAFLGGVVKHCVTIDLVKYYSHRRSARLPRDNSSPKDLMALTVFIVSGTPGELMLLRRPIIRPDAALGSSLVLNQHECISSQACDAEFRFVCSTLSELSWGRTMRREPLRL